MVKKQDLLIEIGTEELPPKSLKNLKKKISNNKYYKDELSESGQIVIRDLVLRDPTKFLFLIDTREKL